MTQYLSNLITGHIAQPPTIVDSAVNGGNLRRVAETAEIADTGNGDSLIMVPIPVDAIIDDIEFAADDLTSGNADVGLWKRNADGTFTAVDDDCFATQISFGSGAIARGSILHEAAAANIVNVNKKAWEWANLSAKPSYDFLYVGLLNDTGTGATGTVSLWAYYTA